MVDEAYLDRDNWIKKSIKTVAKVRLTNSFLVLFVMSYADGEVQL